MFEKKKILLVGGAGYIGTELVKHLLSDYEVTIYDLFIFGNNFSKTSNNLKIIKGDIRDINFFTKHLKDYFAVIHLACISNDPSFDLNPDLGKSINYDFFEQLVINCKNSGVKRFIYASSASVYGVKSEKNVSENSSLEPLTDYSKYKALCEDIVLKHADKNFVSTILRPATVCGYSERQRLDLVVNILTNIAFNKKEITIFGGNQLRPNLHIFDMCMAYKTLLESEELKINKKIYNVGFENHKVSYLANIVKNIIGEDVKLIYVQSDDNRSYHISSNKIQEELNFKPKLTVEDAVKDLKFAFEKNLLFDPLNNEMYFNIKRMKSINLN